MPSPFDLEAWKASKFLPWKGLKCRSMLHIIGHKKEEPSGFRAFFKGDEMS